MRRALVGFALATGCYNPTVSPGTFCNTACPGDLVCIDHICTSSGAEPDAPIADAPHDAPPIDAIDGPPGDVDGDGITDNADNCPSKPNVDQHDEDADALGDVCDPCPHLAGNAADGDGDGVGDECDPQPTIAKQRIKFFDPFTSALPEWQLNTGASRVGETLRILGASAGGANLLVANAESRFVTAGTIVSVSSALPHQVSISFGQSGGQYHYCEFYDDGAATGDVSITKANSGTYTGISTVQYPGVLPTGIWGMQIDESVAAQRITLDAKLGGVSYAPPPANTSTSPTLGSGARFAFYVQNADVRLDYVLVIETLP